MEEKQSARNGNPTDGYSPDNEVRELRRELGQLHQALGFTLIAVCRAGVVPKVRAEVDEMVTWVQSPSLDIVVHELERTADTIRSRKEV